MSGSFLIRIIRILTFLLTSSAVVPAFANAAAVVDTTPPTITAEATTAPNANGWYRSNVRVKFTCADTQSKIAVCPAVIVVSAEGANQVISGTARDKAGNTATASVTLNIDKTGPVVTAARSPEAPAGGWSITPVTVTFDAADALSGVAPGSLTAPITLSTDRVNGSATGHATDLAGNAASFKLTGINIDQAPPRISVTLSPAAVRGYRASPVTAHFTCSDAKSGIVGCPPDQVFSADGANLSVTGTVFDRAGHSATVSKTFKIDATAPVIAVTSLAAGSTAGATTGIAGTVSDGLSGVASLVADGHVVRVRAGGAFTYGPLTLAEGTNTFTLVATDRAGNASQRAVTIEVAPPPPPDPPPAPPADPDPGPPPPPPPPPPQACTNQMADGQFDSGVSGFYKQDESSQVARTTESPIEGASSLRVAIAGYGNNVWWTQNFSGGLASQLTVGARLRSDLESSSDLAFCAMVYYLDGSDASNCRSVSGAAGDKGTVGVSLTLDASKPLASVNIRMYQVGGDPVSFTLDAATACLQVVAPPTPGGGGGGGGGGGDTGGGGGSPGGGSPSCTPSANSVYHGYAYQLPTIRPFIPLTHYTQGGPNSTAATRLRTAADAAIAGDAPYAYSPALALLAYRLTGEAKYLTDAIARVDGFVTEFETSIAAGQRPAIAGDSYLDIGWYLENLSLVYDHGYEQLTDSQRLRWAAIADQAIFNLWHPADATWGDVAFPWSGWAICDAGNNYHFSFLRATMLWALASQNAATIDFLQTRKFPLVLDYYAAFPGGGTREGTGYGGAIGGLFLDYMYWKAGTGEDLANITPHPKETIDYWVHATVPTRDRFAPIADLARESIPNIFDYQENMIHQAVVLSTGTPQARRGTWWLQNNSVNGVAYVFNIAGDLLPYPDAPEAPTDLMYHAPGAGALFARTSWNTDAAWFAFIAGRFDQSHQHQDQGSFTFFKNDWLAVTNNIWSYSGLHQEVEAHNTLRFERADGSVISQNQSSTVASSMTPSITAGVTTVRADLANAYWANASAIQSWTRTLELSGDTLRVTDACTVAAGVRPIFQLQVPAVPVLQADGSIQAGNLRVVLLQPATFAAVPMNAVEFQKGYRIDLTSTAGCGFSVELQAAAGTTPNPDPGPGPNPNPHPDPNPSPNPCGGSLCSTDPVEPIWSETGVATSGSVSIQGSIYLPSAGSPLVSAGDPADGAGTLIGAIGPNGNTLVVDRFGRIVPQ